MRSIRVREAVGSLVVAYHVEIRPVVHTAYPGGVQRHSLASIPEGGDEGVAVPVKDQESWHQT